MKVVPSETLIVFLFPDTHKEHIGVVKYSYLNIEEGIIKYIVALGNDFEDINSPNVFQIDDTMVEYILFKDHSHSYYTIIPDSFVVELLNLK